MASERRPFEPMAQPLGAYVGPLSLIGNEPWAILVGLALNLLILVPVLGSMLIFRAARGFSG
ncbi:MAG: hypothetical protein AB7N24_08785 [Dehalococcoidia bacterium]